MALAPAHAGRVSIGGGGVAGIGHGVSRFSHAVDCAPYVQVTKYRQPSRARLDGREAGRERVRRQSALDQACS
jgi:hypothetical protein